MAGYLGIEACDDRPYVFISYNTEDQKRLSSIAAALSDYRIHIWYDNGIQRTSEEEWQEQIALHIRDAELVFFFISRGIFTKKNSFVRKEYDLAARHGKKICIILLDDIDERTIPAKYDFWWDDIQKKQCIDAVDMTDQEIADEIFGECRRTGAFEDPGEGYDKVYCYRNSPVLKNRLDIIDEAVLQDTVNGIVRPLAKEVIERPPRGRYDYVYLKKLHKKLYGQIFDWAGHTRTVDISDQLNYCHHNYISLQAEAVFEQLRKENCLQNCPEDRKHARLAYYLGELNAIHPFRYGNQVVQEVFLSILGRKIGCVLDFDLADRDRLTEGYTRSFFGEMGLLEQELIRIDTAQPV